MESQTYGEIEWVICDASPTPPQWLSSLRVPYRYVQAPLGRPVGWMRNQANRAARGDVILHWDDDDWYGPRSVEARAAALTPMVSVVDISTYYVLHTGPNPYAERSITWAETRKGSGNTLGYWRDVWEKTPFTTHKAEDRTFVRPYYNRMVSLRDPSLVVYVRHGQNTCLWPRVGLDECTDEVQRLMGESFDFYKKV